ADIRFHVSAYTQMTTIRLTSTEKRKLQKAQEILEKRSARSGPRGGRRGPRGVRPPASDPPGPGFRRDEAGLRGRSLLRSLDHLRHRRHGRAHPRSGLVRTALTGGPRVPEAWGKVNRG